jgi:hypothetical protein
MVGSRGWEGKGMKRWCRMGQNFSWEGEKVLELDSENG